MKIRFGLLPWCDSIARWTRHRTWIQSSSHFKWMSKCSQSLSHLWIFNLIQTKSGLRRRYSGRIWIEWPRWITGLHQTLGWPAASRSGAFVQNDVAADEDTSVVWSQFARCRPLFALRLPLDGNDVTAVHLKPDTDPNVRMGVFALGTLCQSRWKMCNMKIFSLF